MTCTEGASHSISIHPLKYSLSTLIQGVALAFRHQLFENGLHRFYFNHQMVQFRELALGECFPALRRAGDVAETKEQLPDFRQCKTELARAMNNGQAVEHTGIITSLPTSPFCGRKQANPLVVTDRRRLNSNLLRDLRNG